METLKFEQLKNSQETFPEILIEPKETFPSKITPIFESQIIDKNTGLKIGSVDFQLNHRQKTLIIQSVAIEKPKQGYGVSLYTYLQSRYPEYQLVSSDQIRAKSDESQEKPNAIYLWEKLVRLGYAEGDKKSGFKMKNNSDPHAST